MEEVILPEKSNEKEIKPKNPWIAGVLNIILPGLGYFYIKKTKLSVIIVLTVPILYVFLDLILLSFTERFGGILHSIFHFALPLFFFVHGTYLATKVTNQDYKKIFNLFLCTIFLIIGLFYYTMVYDSNFKTYSCIIHSMTNTIQPHDKMLTRMNYYGLYLPTLNKKICTLQKPDRNQVVVFTRTENDTSDVQPKYEVFRIIAKAGDTIKIRNKNCYINGTKEKQTVEYQYDVNSITDTNFVPDLIYPKGASWNENNYGPLYIPKKGDIIKIDKNTVLYWSQLIVKENLKIKVFEDELIQNILKLGVYEIKENYYFVMGDNRDYSFDSRYHGLVAESEIVGKPELIVGGLSDFFEQFSNNSRIGYKIK